MKQVYARIKEQGLIEITASKPFSSQGTDQSGDLKNYKIDTAEELLKACRRCFEVLRPNGKIELGEKYSLKKAINDLEIIKHNENK